MIDQLPLWLSLGAFLISIGSIGQLLYSRRTMRQLVSVSNKGSIDGILEDVMTHLRSSKKRQAEIETILSQFQNDSQAHIQCVGFIRFNPFSDTGGKQSFALAFLDGHHNGIVISSLRDSKDTRLFAKPVRVGKEDGYEFSHEERIAIQRAIHDT